jgi:hypothetical protein
LSVIRNPFKVDPLLLRGLPPPHPHGINAAAPEGLPAGGSWPCNISKDRFNYQLQPFIGVFSKKPPYRALGDATAAGGAEGETPKSVFKELIRMKKIGG